MNEVLKWFGAVLLSAAFMGMFIDTGRISIYCGLLLIAILLLLLTKSWHHGRRSEGDKGGSGGGNNSDGRVDGGLFKPLTTEEATFTLGEISYFENYLSLIERKHGVAAKNRMRHDVISIMGGNDVDGSKVPGRVNEILERGKRRVKGLVCGHCQEGKTGNFTGVITKAIDDGYNVIMILTTSNKALKQQTVMRLQKDLTASGLVEDRYHLIADFIAAFKKDDLPSLSDLATGGIHIGVALKQVDHLRGRGNNGKGIRGWLQDNLQYLDRAKVLLIDDEADAYTQNNASGTDVWSEDSVLAYANTILDKAGTEIERRNNVAIATWLKNLVEQYSGALDAHQADVFKLLEGECSDDAIKKIVYEYTKELGLDQPVGGEPMLALIPLSGIVENFFTRDAESNKITGRSFRRDFFDILRWFLGVERERSAINQALCDLVRVGTFSPDFGRLVYIGYTATPYACFLNERRGADNPLELDFAIPMSRTPEYLGLAEIFGSSANGVDENVPRLPIVRTIPAREKDEVTLPLMDGKGNVVLDEDLNYTYTYGIKRSTGSWESLKDAVKWAFCAASVRRDNRITKGVHDTGDDTWEVRCSTMLINLSRKMENHDDLVAKLAAYIKHVMECPEDFKKQCLKVFDEISRDVTSASFKNELVDYPLAVADINRCSVEKNLDYMMEHFEVIALNSDEANREYDRYVQNVKDKKDGDWLWFVVGGNRISRGLTFPGLVSSYFDRDKPGVNADTLIQMGRWLGYRIGYELLPRVWMPDGSVKSMKDICRLEEELHVQLHAMFDGGESATNPRMRAISRRITHADAGILVTPPVENMFFTRTLRAGNARIGIRVLSDFLNNCGTPERREGAHIYERLTIWRNVKPVDKKKSVIVPFLQQMGSIIAREEYDDLKRIWHVIKDVPCDVVLSDPQNELKTERIDGIGVDVHPHNSSNFTPLGGNFICFGKFAGQYDAWRAFIPTDIVERIQVEYGNKANSQKALDEMYRLARQRDNRPIRPILQVGLIAAPDGLVVYAGFYWPCRGEDLVGGFIKQDSVL